MFLENETWELCPVKSNFNISQLHVSKNHIAEARKWSTVAFIYSTLSLIAPPHHCEICIRIWNTGDPAQWFLCRCGCVCHFVSLCINLCYTACYITEMTKIWLLSLMPCMLDIFIPHTLEHIHMKHSISETKVHHIQTPPTYCTCLVVSHGFNQL